MYFYLTIGPVQSFVSQARRTRDFWAGSFLLSWLAGVAILAVEQQGGTIEFPCPQEDYLKWLVGEGVGSRPLQGAIPNRFKATVGADFDARLVTQSVREAWQQLAYHVWQQDLHFLDEASIHFEIWQRQHRNFWEISWLLSADDVPNGLDRRKNWRTHVSAPEPGVKCMVMDGWQELSGAERPNSQVQKSFWQDLRASVTPGIRTDIAEGERLCAIAFVKRRFARHFASFTAQDSGLSLPLKGWTLPVSVPSVSYMASVHWLETILRHENRNQVFAVLEAARALDADNDEWETRIACLEDARRVHEVGRPLIARDGSVFFSGVRDDASPQEKVSRVAQVRDFQCQLKTLDLQSPLSPFYAILLMDGDSLGVQMSDKEKQPRIAQALNRFTESVPAVVLAHNGFLIYAGGDDVLAILPLEDAFPCATALRHAYLEACHSQSIESTLSGAIEFVHIKVALGRVLADAHHLLDEIAKDGCGRDGIAVRVWKPGGCDLQWAQPWSVALDSAEAQTAIIDELARRLEAAEAGTPFSNGFFYKIRERFELLNPAPGQATSLLNEEQAGLLLATDYVASGIHAREHRPTLSEAQSLIEPLLQQCCPYERHTNETDGISVCTPKQPLRLEADGALLLRFLAHKGLDQQGGLR